MGGRSASRGVVSAKSATVQTFSSSPSCQPPLNPVPHRCLHPVPRLENPETLTYGKHQPSPKSSLPSSFIFSGVTENRRRCQFLGAPSPLERSPQVIRRAARGAEPGAGSGQWRGSRMWMTNVHGSSTCTCTLQGRKGSEVMTCLHEVLGESADLLSRVIGPHPNQSRYQSAARWSK